MQFYLPYYIIKEWTSRKNIEISQNSQENTCARASFLIILQASACNFIKKETLAGTGVFLWILRYF